MTAWLQREDYEVNSKRVRRLMRLMGLEAIYAKPRLSASGKAHKRYPYLLKDVVIERADQVWSADITYLRLHSSFLYLVAVMDWFSRYVLSWALSRSLQGEFCVWALEEVPLPSTVVRPRVPLIDAFHRSRAAIRANGNVFCPSILHFTSTFHCS